MGIKPKYTECKPPEWTKEDLKAYGWCVEHGIYISALAAAKGNFCKDWYIQVEAKGKKVVSPKTYGPDDLYKKIFELYRFYYDKNTK